MIRVRLAELLGQRKLRVADLYKMTGIRYNTLNDLYYEMAISIKIEHIESICNALNCEPNDLFNITPRKRLLREHDIKK